MKTIAICYFSACAAYAALAYGPTACGMLSGFIGNAVNLVADLTLPRSKR